MGAVIFPNNAGYYSATECRIMGPRAADTLNANDVRFYRMVNGKRVTLATRIHRIYGDEIQSHHAPYNLDAGKSVNKNEIIEYFKNKPCTGFFFTAELSCDSLVLVTCN